jgi:Mg/Co/Ni transporter MgtE
MGKGSSGGGDAPDMGMPYLEQTLALIVSARVGWLALFFAGLLLTMIIMQGFEEVLEANVQLSFFVPLIVGHAGNTGSQAVSTVIRALALDEAAVSDYPHIIVKEFGAGGAIGLFLGTFAFPMGVYLAGIPLRVMFSVAISLPSVSCVANLIGAGLPLICEKFSLDPAVIAAPMMTTMVDCSGILTYLMISQVCRHRGGLEGHAPHTAPLFSTKQARP